MAWLVPLPSSLGCDILLIVSLGSADAHLGWAMLE